MIAEGYASTLKRLITFTQAKFISLADVVGYDVSYVNKWSNGTKLPLHDMSNGLMKKWAAIFLSSLRSKRKRINFIKPSPLPKMPKI